MTSIYKNAIILQVTENEEMYLGITFMKGCFECKAILFFVD